MSQHIALGKMGEKLASEFLVKKGYSILHQNWRFRHWEIDIIARKENVIHFVEVKTRRNTNFGYPEQAVTPRKIHYLAEAATEFQYQYPGSKIISFDIISILLKDDGTEEYFFIEDIDI